MTGFGGFGGAGGINAARTAQSSGVQRSNPQLINSAVGGASGVASFNVNISSWDIQEGDLLVMFARTDSDDSLQPPVGWSSVVAQDIINDNLNAVMRRANPADAKSTTFAKNDPGQASSFDWILCQFRDARYVDSEANTSSSSGSSSLAITGIPLEVGYGKLLCLMYSSASNPVTPPASMSLLVPGNNAADNLYSEDVAAAGPTGTRTFTRAGTSGQFGGILFHLY